MRPGFRKAWIVLVFFCIIFLTGYLMNNLLMKAPSASASIQAPAGMSAEAVLSCAETTVQKLASDDDRWDARVTRKDIEAGTLETGDFEEENESGFRVKVSFDRRTSKIGIALKGAGAYFVDLGVESAIGEFNSAMNQCLAR
jgi:hypothetical protein